MKFLSLFSGIEAASVAWGELGWECIALSEIEPFPCAVLAHRFPNVPNIGDVTKITEEDIKRLGAIDLIVFGSPCQDLSVAGKRTGLQGGRSGLFYTAIRLIQWARKHCGCRFAVWENVPGVFSSNQGRDFAEVVREMAGLRSCAVPKNGWGAEGVAVGDNGLLEWGVLDAQYFGVPQRRRRVFAIADFGDWQNREPILLERNSLRGNIAPSRSAGQNITKNAGNNTAPANDNYILFEPRSADGVPRIASDQTLCPTLNRMGGGQREPCIATKFVRRLTPLECERLQGFPDDWTKIPYRNKSAEQCPDGPRYSACGNSMPVPVMRWIGKRILNAIKQAQI